MKILVCGGRDFDDRDLFYKAMKPYLYDKTVSIIHGAAPGADTIAGDWAHAFGHQVESFPADWTKYGKRAGYIRHTQMLNEGKPDMVVAFPGGKGTSMMIKLAEAAGVPVVKIND